ncbi:MAG: carboxypeptidase-like regulatory domain-containing protein [Acidimicrobiales bacterium]
MLFRDPGTSYADRFSGNAPSFATSSTITVPESGSHVEDVTMIELGAVFSGTVTDTGANPVAGAIVEARTFLDAVIATATTDASGNYTLPDVGAGTYRIHVEDPSGTYTNVFHPAIQYGAAATNFVVVDGDAVDVDLNRRSAPRSTARSPWATRPPARCSSAWSVPPTARIPTYAVTDPAGNWELRGAHDRADQDPLPRPQLVYQRARRSGFDLSSRRTST